MKNKLMDKEIDGYNLNHFKVNMKDIVDDFYRRYIDYLECGIFLDDGKEDKNIRNFDDFYEKYFDDYLNDNFVLENKKWFQKRYYYDEDNFLMEMDKG